MKLKHITAHVKGLPYQQVRCFPSLQSEARVKITRRKCNRNASRSCFWDRFGRRACQFLESLNNDDGDGNENGKKVIGLNWQNNNIVRASRFLVHFLPSLRDYNVKVPNFTFCRGREHKTTTFFFFSFPKL